MLAQGGIPANLQIWLFLAFAAAFAIKVPMWPLHSWLPDAHVEAPTAGSVILAGVLLKMGTYGFLRFNLPLFPYAAVKLAPWMAALAVIGILYGAAVSYAQKDVKKLVAYSSVSHLGFVMLGLFALNSQGIQGGILQMVNHGLSTGALFLIVGMIYERRHTRDMDAFGGLWKIMPIYGVLTLIVALSSMGLPGLNGFVGEFTILLGAWGAGQPDGSYGTYWFAALAAIGVILAAVYILFMFQKLFLGPVTKDENRKFEGFELARDRDPGPADHLDLLDWPVSQTFLHADGSDGGQSGSSYSDCVSGDDPVRACPWHDRSMVMTSDLLVSLGAILPLIVLVGWACVLLLVDLAIPKERKGWTALLAALGLLVTAGFVLSRFGKPMVGFRGHDRSRMTLPIS